MNGTSGVVHFELPADELERAKKFYEGVFGWQLMQMGEDMGNYVLATTTESGDNGPLKPGAINGGITQRGGSVTVPSVSIDVPSIEEALIKIKAAGGEVVAEKMPVGEMGFIAYFKDSEGNVLSLWETAPQK